MAKRGDKAVDLEHENAELRRQLAESLARQAATAEVLQVISLSTFDLSAVLQTVVSTAHRLCRADHAVMFRNEGGEYRWAAGHAMTAASEERERSAVIRPGTGTLIGRAVLEGRPVQIEDAWSDPLYEAKEDARAGGVRSMLGVPLMRDGEPIGVMGLARNRVEPFNAGQIEIVATFAAQAVIAIENARLITETREALDQQTATAEVLQVINSSPGDLAPVFDAMLEKAMRLCEVAFGSLQTYDGEQFHSVAERGLPAAFVDRLRRGYRPGPMHFASRLISGERFVQVPDLAVSDTAQGAFEIGGMRSLLSVPLLREERVIGIINLARDRVEPFSDKQIALVQNFAAQAVIAMENARLISETQEALDQQTATAEVLQVINSSPGDLAPVFDAIVEKAHALCDAASGSLQLWDGAKFTGVAMRGFPEGMMEALRQGYDPKPMPCQRLVEGERVVHCPDLSEVNNPTAQAGVAMGGIRTILYVALRKDDVLLGQIVAARREVRPFSQKEIALVENFAAQAVIAMENARLLGELRQRTEEVGALNRDLEARVAEQVDELGRVGRLKRFLAPQLAELIVSLGDENILESHRREIVVVFCDLRGYTAFTETAEPEEVLDFLREYHGALGPLVAQFEGTLDQFSGDGIMVFFNDPVPCPDPAERAVKMAMAMRETAGNLIAAWRRRGRDLGFGAGIAQGYATLGQIGFAERSGYTAIGTVCNLAARLCGEAKDGQILVAQRVAAAVEAGVVLEELGSLSLKGLTQPVVAFNVAQSAETAANRLRLV
jgi:class 3 adenylate cyclase/putative methionine-R-sulfoxide reductase with GAF domain